MEWVGIWKDGHADLARKVPLVHCTIWKIWEMGRTGEKGEKPKNNLQFTKK
jgi:hypothetical protein